MAKGLLVLAGGRLMPSMLTIIHEKPDLIVALVSKDQTYQIQNLQRALQELFPEKAPDLDVSHEVDAFCVEDIYTHCLQVVEEHPDFQWLFNITSGTSIMSIGAYEAVRHLEAQGKSIRCWYLATNHTKLVPLFGEGRDNEIFHITVEQYAATYGCRLKTGKMGKSESVKGWLPFVYFLIKEPEYIDPLQRMLAQSGVNDQGPGNIPKHYPIPKKTPLNKTPEWSRILAEASSVGLVSNMVEQNDKISFELTDMQAHFLNGHWLEAYIWNEADKRRIFSDCRLDLELFYSALLGNGPGNQLDVSMIYKAQLFIAECKTGNADFFEKEVLDELDATTQLLGKGFVGKLLVASWLEKPYGRENYNRQQQEKIERFKERAKYLGIEVVTREKLAEIGTIIEKIVVDRTRG